VRYCDNREWPWLDSAHALLQEDVRGREPLLFLKDGGSRRQREALMTWCKGEERVEVKRVNERWRSLEWRSVNVRGTGPTKPNRGEWRVNCVLMTQTRQPNYFITFSRHAAHLDNWAGWEDNTLTHSSQRWRSAVGVGGIQMCDITLQWDNFCAYVLVIWRYKRYTGLQSHISYITQNYSFACSFVWELKLISNVHRLMIYEKRVMIIFGLKRDETVRGWGKLNNEVVRCIYLSLEVMRTTKSGRMRWINRIERFGVSVTFTVCWWEWERRGCVGVTIILRWILEEHNGIIGTESLTMW
jgi:hypothetical protein